MRTIYVTGLHLRKALLRRNVIETESGTEASCSELPSSDCVQVESEVRDVGVEESIDVILTKQAHCDEVLTGLYFRERLASVSINTWIQASKTLMSDMFITTEVHQYTFN